MPLQKVQSAVSKRSDHFHQMISSVKKVTISSPIEVKLFCNFISQWSKYCINQYQKVLTSENPYNTVGKESP